MKVLTPNVFFAKWVDGQVFHAAKGMQNDVTVFCDAKAIREDPSIVALSKGGPALRRNRKSNLAFDFVCPTHPQYRAKVFDYLDNISKQANISGVTLNLYHFPDQDYCICPRCTEQRQKSGLDWTQWRAQTVTSFLKEAIYCKVTFVWKCSPTQSWLKNGLE